MLVKFFNRGKGKGSGPVDYLLGKERKRAQATLLRGSPEQTIDLIDSLSFSKRYTSGALSFSEADISKDLKDKIMDSFEKAILSGLSKDQYDILWVEHKDKDRLELNFVIPTVELKTGKRLQPYYDKVDRKRINAWQTIVNGSFGFDDPHDPARERFSSFPSDLPKQKEEASRLITNGLTAMLSAGVIKDRASVLSTLRDAGFEITRETKSSISIKAKGDDRPLRLKGKLYERDFKFSEDVREEREATIRKYKEERKQRVQQAKYTYQEASRAKREEHRKRFSGPKRKNGEGSVSCSDINTENLRVRADSGVSDIGGSNGTTVKITNNWIKELINAHERRTAAIVGSITASILTARAAIADRLRRDEFATREVGRTGARKGYATPSRRKSEWIQEPSSGRKAQVRTSRKASQRRKSQRPRESLPMRTL